MNLGTWRDIAIVFLAIQCFVIMLVPLVVTFFLVRGINMASGALPGYLRQAQGFTRMVRLRTVETSSQISEPLVRLRGQQAAVEATLRSFSTQVDESIYGPRDPDHDMHGLVNDSQGAGNESES